ncbi:MAG: hypothetical protein AB7Q97_25475 [Gammaproteobacteria bacterium]
MDERGPDSAPAVDEAATNDPERPWYPPLGPIRTYFLIALTFGLYAPFWVYRLARDARDHDPAQSYVSPVLRAIGTLVPFVSWFVIYRMTESLEGLAQRFVPPSQPGYADSLAGAVPRKRFRRYVPSPATVTGWYFVTSATAGILGRSDLAIPTVAGMLVLPVAFVMLQSALNQVKSALPAPAWRGRPYRYSRLQIGAIAVSLLVWAGVVATVVDEIRWYRADPVVAGTHLAIRGTPFVLAVPTGRWREAPPGSINSDSVVDLYGSTNETFVVAYTHAGAPSLDELVQGRQQAMQGQFKELQFEESRTLLAGGQNIPVSIASYRGKSALGGEQMAWVASVVSAPHAVEVVAFTSKVTEQGRAIESIARALIWSGPP